MTFFLLFYCTCRLLSYTTWHWSEKRAIPLNSGIRKDKFRFLEYLLCESSRCKNFFLQNRLSALFYTIKIWIMVETDEEVQFYQTVIQSDTRNQEAIL